MACRKYHQSFKDSFFTSVTSLPFLYITDDDSHRVPVLSRVARSLWPRVSLGSKSDLLRRPSFSPRLINIMLFDFTAAQCRRLQLCLFLRAGLPRRRRRARRSQPVCGWKSSGLLGLCWPRIRPDGPVPGSAGSHGGLQHAHQPGL